MKASVLYYSQTGRTKRMAEVIAGAMNEVDGVEATAFSITDLDEAFVTESGCVILGTPIYMADVAGQVKVWLEQEAKKLHLGGKLGGAFATADYVHGGANLGLQTVLGHFMVLGMMTYSGGSAWGKPYIHHGPVALKENIESYDETFAVYGRRMAQQALKIFV